MILVVGGTSDALELAEKLQTAYGNVTVSTATEYGSEISRERFPGRVITGRMSRDDLKNYVVKNGTKVIVDASHPYAENISANAIAVTQELGLGYARFERPRILQSEDDTKICSSYEEAGVLADQMSGGIFITLGINNVERVLAKISDKKRVRVRVLPQSQTLEKLESLGLNADHIIAMKGPYSEDMNYLMMKEAGAKIMMMKDSGQQGGTDHKIAAAKRLGLKIIMVSRPKLDYPNEFHDFAAVLKFVGNTLSAEGGN